MYVPSISGQPFWERLTPGQGCYRIYKMGLELMVGMSLALYKLTPLIALGTIYSILTNISALARRLSSLCLKQAQRKLVYV